ncbi:strawberry notch family protein [bacterium]|nr:strawberry notch family protein [bacterium]
MASSNPFGKPSQADNPFGKSANPFGQAEEENPFGLEEEEDEDELGYIPKMSSRIRAGWEEAAGGTLTSTAREHREKKGYFDRVREELDETKFRPQEGILANVKEAGRAVAESIKLPYDVTFGAAGAEAVQGTLEAMPGGDEAIDEMETIGLDMFNRGKKRREDAGEFDIDRPDGFEVGQGLKYYGTQMIESLGANMAPAMAMGVVTRGRIKALNNITAKHGVKAIDLDAAAQIGGLGTMGATVYGAEYERSYQENGFDHEAATQDATVAMFAEVIPEILPFGLAMKAAGPALAKAVKSMGGWKGVAKQIAGGTLLEGGSEVLTEIINEAYEVWGKDGEFKYEEFKTQMVDAFMVGALMGGVMNIPAAASEFKQKPEAKEADVPGVTPAKPPKPDGPDGPAGPAPVDAVGGIDLSTMEPLHVEQQLEPMDLNQPIEYIEGPDGQQLDPLDLDQPIPDQGIPIPEEGIDPNLPPDDPFGSAGEVIEEPVVDKPQVIGKTFDELETDDEFVAWKENELAPMRAQLQTMRYESPEQLKAQAEDRKANPNREKTPGWNVNPGKDNLLTEIAKNGGLWTDEWVSEHGVDISGVREKGGANWVAGAANPLFSKYKKAMKPDALAEFLNQSNPKSWNIDDKYLDENGMLTATTVGDLVNDMIADPDAFGGAEYTAAREFEAEIERVSDGYESAWRDRQEAAALKKKFEDGDPEIMAEMEDPGRPDEFYGEDWGVEAKTLADWMGEAIEIGVTEAEVEAATAGKPITEQVRALHELIEAKDDEIIEEQLAETFKPRSPETSDEVSGGEQTGETVSEEADQPENPLTQDVTAEQEAADAKAAKDKERDGDPDKETTEAGEGEGELFVKDTQETEDLFPGTTLPGETVTETDLKPEAEKIDTTEDPFIAEGFGDLPLSITKLETVKERVAAIYPLEMKKRLENAKLETRRSKLKSGSKLRDTLTDEIDGNKVMLAAMLRYLEKYAPEGSLEGRLPPGIRGITEENVADRLSAIAEIMPLQKKQLEGMEAQVEKGESYPILLKKVAQYKEFIAAMEQYVAENEVPTQPVKEKDDEVSRQEDRRRLQQGQDEEGKRAAESGEQPPVRASDQAESGQVDEKEAEGENVPPVASFEEMVAEAARWKGATMHLAESFDTTTREGKKAAMALSRATNKADLDAYLMEKFGIDESDARSVSNALTAQDIKPDMSANLEDFKDEPWYQTEQVTEQVTDQVEEEDPLTKAIADIEAIADRLKTAEKTPEKSAEKAEKKQKVKKAETKPGKLENTGADLRRHWDKLKADLEAAQSSGEKAWKLVHGKTARAKLFNPKPGEGATPGTQRYYDAVQAQVYTFAQVLEKWWSLSGTTGYYGSPTGEQVAERIDSNGYPWATAALLTDFAREYAGMMEKVSRALDGAKTVEEAEKLVATIMDTGKLNRWSDPNYADETMHMPVPKKTEDQDAKTQGPFIGHGMNKYVVNKKIPDSETTQGYKRDINSQYVRDEDGRIQSIQIRRNIPTPLAHLIDWQMTDDAAGGTKKRAKSAHNRVRIVSVERTVEKKVRDGDAAPLAAKKEFGFADVGFGSWVLKGKDQSHMNAAWDAFSDLADRLGIPHAAIGFYGKLHFTIGALGHGRHAAHFQRSQPHPDGGTVPVINLTNTKGDGAVAHEWAHALDITGAKGDAQYVIDLIKRELAATRNIANLEAKIRAAIRPGGPYMTRSGKRGSLENVQALAYWHMNRRGTPTEFKKNADKLGKDYWGSDTEMFARAWEAFIFDTLEGENNYLVNDWVSEGAVGPKQGYKGYVYPMTEERVRFNHLFEALIASMEEKTVDGKKELHINRKKFDAKLPDEVKNYQEKAQAIYDRIPEMMEEYKREAEEAQQKKQDENAQHEAAKWAKAKEEAAAEERIRLEAIAQEEGEKADSVQAGNVSELDGDAELTEELLEALFDEALENVQSEMQAEDETTPPLQTEAEQDELPKKKKWTRTTVFPGPEKVAESEAAVTKPDPTAASLIAAAKEEGVEGINEALAALAKIFPPNKLQSFPPTIEKEAYDKAKPHFEASLEAFQKSGKALVDLFGFLIKQFGAGIKPYLVHWAKEGKLTNNLSSNMPSEAPPLAPESLAEFLETQDMYDITDNLRLIAALTTYYGRKPSETDIKAGQEAYELVLVRKAQAIVRENLGNRQATFDKLLKLYENQPNLNSRSATSISQQAYSTPMPLAYLASELSGINSGTTVYEPTAGNGALLIGANPVKTVVNELNAGRAANLRANGWAANEFDATAWKPSSNYDAAIMNPPFGALDKAVKVDGYTISKIDHQIVTKALEGLKDNGRATLIIGANKEAGATDQKTKIFLNWLYANYNVIDHFEVAGDLYRKQGAGWPVAVITINGRKVSDAVFDANVERYSTWSEINEHTTDVLGSEGFTGRTASSTESTRSSTEDVDGTPEQTGSVSDNTGKGSESKSGKRGTGGSSVSDSTGAGVVREQADRPGRSDTDGAGQRSSGEQLPAAGESGAGSKGAATGTQQDGKSARPLDKSEWELENGSDYQINYRPGSVGLNEAVLMPVNMRTAVETAMNKLRKEVGDLDAYVMKKLGYKSLDEMHSSVTDSTGFMALQVDAIAAMIYNIENNNRGTIVADQTGVGKGRQAAAMIRYALQNDRIPVFVTAKANLFTDMYDDLLDIGETGAKPFIFNADGGFITDREGGKPKFKVSAPKRKASLIGLAAGTMPEGTNMLMLTYDQVNSISPKRLQRPAVEGLEKMDKKPMYIFDESHNIAGDRAKYNKAAKEMLPTTAGWFFNLIQDQPVMYLSATYAKRADNMPIYYRTDIIDAVDDIDQLEDAINAGGEALQTVVANMLAQSGQLWRRERSFEGITFATTTFGYDLDGNVQPEKDAERKTHEQISDSATKGLREIVRVDNIVSEWLDDNGREITDELIGETGGEMKNPGAMMESLMGHSPFTSRVHNFTKQLLLSLKADWIVEEAIAQHKAGKKPVIGLDNTMESFLKGEIERGNATMGDPWTGDYRSILRAALATTRRVSLTNKKGDTERVTVPLNMLPMHLQQLYKQTEAKIDKLQLKDVTLFYIDYIRNKLEAAGIKTGEITGRKLMIDYADDMKIKNRPDSAKKFRRETIDKFNSGELDCLILNAAGSTGLSIHAGVNFKNKDGSKQRPRHMMIAQAMPDINILMQMFGRINRTGQTEIPSYAMLGLDLPSEQRPMAMTARKMRQLNAQTTANTESETSLNVASILNKYGDTVVKQIMLENIDLQTLTGYSIDEKTPSEGMAMKFTGKLALAPVQTQREVWAMIQEDYSEYIAWLDATNQNDLKTDIVDLDARIIDNKTVYEGKDPTTLFGGNTVLHKISAKVQGRPPSAYEMTTAVEAAMDGKGVGELARELIAQTKEDSQIEALVKQKEDRYAKSRELYGDETKSKERQELLEEMAGFRDRANKEEEARREMQRAINTYTIGSAWKLDLGDDVVTGVVIGAEHVHKKGKGSPFSQSKLRIKFMVNSEARQVTIPLSKILKGDVIESQLYTRDPSALNNLFNSRSGTSARETRYIATGNLLGGYSSLQAGGRVISFTAANGQTYSGILMPKKFGKKGEYDGQDAEQIIMRDPAETSAYLRGTRANYSLKQVGVYNMPNQSVRIKPSQWGSGFEVSVLRKRSQAGDRVKFDKQLVEAMGGQEFVGRTQVLTVTITDQQLDATVKRITELGALYIPGSGLATLQQITGRSRAEAAISFDGSMENDESLRETFEEADEGGLFDTSDGDAKPKFNMQNGIDFDVDTSAPASEGKVTFWSQKLEASMGVMLGKKVETGTFEEVEAPPKYNAIAKVIEKVFGRRVVFFQKSGKFPFDFNGVMIPRDPKTLYVNINSKKPFAGVTGHELTHAIRVTHPEVYKKLAAIAMRRLQADGFDRFAAQHNEELTEDKMFEEMVSNVVGEAFTDESFINELAREGDGFFKQVMNIITDILRGFQKKMKSKGLGQSEYFNDIENMIAEVQQTLKVWRPSMPANFNPESHEEDAAVFAKPKFNERQEEEQETEQDHGAVGNSFMKKAGIGQKSQSIFMRLRKLMAMPFRPMMRYGMDQVAFSVADKFHGIKKAYREEGIEQDAETSGYVAARLSTGSASVMQGILLHGAPMYNGGVIEKIPDSKGLLEIFEPIQDELNEFLAWMTARRADRLYEEGKENNFTREEIDFGLALIEGKEELWNQVADEFAEFKGAILDVAENAGLIDPLQRLVWDKADWIPFYRIQGTRKKGQAFSKGKGLSGQSSGIRKLTGGEDAMTDPLGGIIMNFNHLMEASMKNEAARKTVDDLKVNPDLVKKRGYAFKGATIPKDQVRQMLIEEGIDEATINMLDEETDGEVFEGVARMWQLADPTSEPDVIKIMRDGKPEFYTIGDEMLMESLSNMALERMKNPVMSAARGAKNLLTTMITAEPTFMLANFMRDSIHAWMINPDGMKLVLESFHGLKAAHTGDRHMISMMFAGGSFQGGFINGTDPEASRKSQRKALRAKGFSNAQIDSHMETVVESTVGLWDRYRSMGDSVENANREAVYEAARRAGKSKAQAVFEAKDLMDFSMHGSSALMKGITETVPFMNARIQGLYKLGRAASTPGLRGMVWRRGSYLAIASILLAMLNDDNDEYQALEEWDKDTYWHFWIGGQHFRFPKPFELGFLFGTMPERMYRYTTGQDTGSKLNNRFWHGVGEALALNPTPQIVKPIIENVANKNFFTGRPIESMGDERKLTKDRYSLSTSDTMRASREALAIVGLSPKEAEALVKGYTGTLGKYLLWATDLAVRTIDGSPVTPMPSISRVPVVGRFWRGSAPPYNTRYGSALYEMLGEVTEVYNSMAEYKKEGRVEDYKEAAQDIDVQKMLKGRAGINNWSKKRRQMRKMDEAIRKDKNMNTFEKKRQLDLLYKQRNRMDEEVFKYYSPLFDRK